MATEDPVRELSEELTCPVCLEYFRDPMIIAECGHNFCGDCLGCCWGAMGLFCLVCKERVDPRKVRPNQQLGNIVKIAKKLSFQRQEAKERICEKHREPLKLFCQTDEILICTVCDIAEEHESHEAIPAEEAAQEYKDKILNCLETLRTKREKILVYIEEVGDESREMLKITESERQQIVAQFTTLHQWLKDEENHLLAKIREVEKEISRKRDDQQAKLAKEHSFLERLIRDMEEKRHQPGSEVLQDVRSSLQRYKERENFKNPVAFPSDLQWKLQGCCDISPFLGGIMKELKDALVSGLEMQKANVTLGPTTADSKLILSEDRRSIQYKRKAQDLPEDPENVYDYSYVLGSDGFTSSCHFWEVSVGNEEGWAVGVARNSVKDTFTFTPEEGIWAVGRKKGRYKAFMEGTDPLLTLCEGLKRVRVSLNYNGGQVAFFDADRGVLLYRFTGASFSGETLCPFFAVCGKGYLRLCP